MKESPYILDINEDDESVALKDILFKYIRYWPWFLAAMLVSLLGGYLYMRYASVSYTSIAKIKIIDDSKELDIASDPLLALSGSPTINLDNEIEIIKSYRLLSQVVDDLNLDVVSHEVGNVKSRETWDVPFTIKKIITEDSLRKPISYRIKLNDNEFIITDEDDVVFTASFNQIDSSVTELPFEIAFKEGTSISEYKDVSYRIVLQKKKEAFLGLSKRLQVKSVNKKGEILSLSLTGESIEKNEAILNTVISKFDQDGILDRQLVSKRTLDFIDERFIYLTRELDSIEVGKQDFKQKNNLSDMQEDVNFALAKKSTNETEVFNLQTQISISKLLKKSVTKNLGHSLLPSDIGLQNTSINNLVANYNTLVLEKEKLEASVGENHPTLQILINQLDRAKQNVLNTVSAHQRQFEISLNKRNQEKNLAGALFSGLPEKEKILRSIERQQSIKENLFLLLLQKREEAAISYAVTAPSIKVVDYGLTDSKPVSPKKIVVYPIALLLGFFIPFGLLFVKYTLDTKIHDRYDIEKFNTGIPILGEIPYLEDAKFMESNDRSILGESFRILSTNVNYMLPKNDLNQAKVIYVTSTIKGEGKTLMSLNLSLAYASLKKKVLLLGADLRNPQLHSYVNVDKNAIGLSDYLNDTRVDWRDCIQNFGSDPFHKVCFSGYIPANAPQLLSSDAFSEFMNLAKIEFDYIIVDTAPTLLVTDTLLISKYADVTLYIVRADYTDKKLINFSEEMQKNQKLNNMAYVVNGVNHGRSGGYNYGYGYGYNEEKIEEPWYNKTFKYVKNAIKKLSERTKNS